VLTTLWIRAVGVILVGFALGKSFAYVGLPSAKLFISDIFLAISLITRPNAILGRWFGSLISFGTLHQYSWMLLLFLQYGVIQALRGFSLGHDRIVVLQELIFNVYPLYFFVGVEVGVRKPEFLRKLVRTQAWFTGIYGLLYIAVLNRIDIFFPGTTVPIFGQTAGALGILSLLCFERNLLPVCIPLCLNAFVMLGMEVRDEWLSFLVGLAVWGALTRKINRLFAGLSLVSVLLLIGYISDFSIPSPRGRGGVISTREIIGRAIAPVDPELSQELTPRARGFAGTTYWRTSWWRAIWASTHHDLETAAFGHAYGFPMTNLVSYLQGEAIRTPHNDFFYALGYTGWIGVLLFYSFLATLIRLAWRVFRLTGQPFGIVFWAIVMSASLFGNLFETPFGAIPVFLWTGLIVAPLCSAEQGLLVTQQFPDLSRILVGHSGRGKQVGSTDAEVPRGLLGERPLL
jgi:hypothetical protein